MNTRGLVRAVVIAAAVAWAGGLPGCGNNRDDANVKFVNKFKIERSASSFTDSRDGKTYKTVKISGQVWMAENLNYQTSNGSWCYRNDDSNCGKYGRLYDWNTAKSACPSGWHLPSREEWDEFVTLVNSAGGGAAGTRLKAASGWHNDDNGSDDFGFSALPGGDRTTGGYFNNAGHVGYWWTATENGALDAYRRGIYYDYDIVDENYYGKELGFSARCIMD